MNRNRQQFVAIAMIAAPCLAAGHAAFAQAGGSPGGSQPSVYASASAAITSISMYSNDSSVTASLFMTPKSDNEGTTGGGQANCYATTEAQYSSFDYTCGVNFADNDVSSTTVIWTIGLHVSGNVVSAKGNANSSISIGSASPTTGSCDSGDGYGQSGSPSGSTYVPGQSNVSVAGTATGSADWYP